MREILFRGKRVDNGEWVEGYYVKAKYHYHKFGIHEDYIITGVQGNGGWLTVLGRHAVIPETVGQYIGITDKNGKKIFEGDIVRCLGGESYMGYREFDKKIIVKEINDFDTILILGNSENVILGNIYDNSELLTAEEEESK